VSWEDFISHEVFTGPQVPPSVFHEAGEPSHQQEVHKTQTTSVSVFVTYQNGTRRLFAVAKRVLSPPRVEGFSFPPSVEQVQDKGKQPLHDEGPSGSQEADFILIQDDDTDLSSKLKEIIREQQDDIHHLSINLERAKWIINYLDQRNKQLEDQQTIMELQNIKANWQAAKRKEIKLTTLEQEIQADRESLLERMNMHLEKMLEKAKKEKKMLRHMTYHYLARNKVCKARIRILKAKLKKAMRKRKEKDRLQILAEASLAQHST